MSFPLDAVSLAGASVSGVTTALTPKYQKKLSKVTKLVNIFVTSAIAVFEMSLSMALDNGKTDEREFCDLQDLHLKIIEELVNVETNSKKIYRTR